MSAQSPNLILGITVVTYWFCVGAMMVRVRRRAKGLRKAFVPRQKLERLMWIVWVPTVILWGLAPFLSISQDPSRHRWMAQPLMTSGHPAVVVLRLTAMGLAILCLVLSIWCWLHMGRDWRMGVDTSGTTKLITDGPFAKVRHPIYTLSITMMVCSVVVVQTALMVVVAVAHIVLMHVKARNEEVFLTRTHGETYTTYRSRTGRFLPRWR